MNKMLIKTTLSNIFTVFCCVVIAIGIVSLIAVIMGIRPFVMISESMHPEVPRNALVLLDTRANMTDVAVGDNVGYVLGKVVAMHKVVSTNSTSPVSSNSTGSDENESAGMADNMTTERVENGAVEDKTLVVKSLADDGESTVTASTYMGKEVLSIPGVGGWIRSVLNYKWVVVGIAGLLIIAGCIPRKRTTVTHQTVQEQG